MTTDAIATRRTTRPETDVRSRVRAVLCGVFSLLLFACLAGSAAAQATKSATSAPPAAAPSPAALISPKLEVAIPFVDFGSVTTDALGIYVSGVYKFLVGIVGILAAVMMMVGGFQYLTAGGDKNRVDAGKKRISNALVGLVLALGSYVLLYSINPNLVQFNSLNIEAVSPEPYVPNETPQEPGMPAPLPPSGPYPTGPGNPPSAVGANNIPFWGQCRQPQRSTPYLAQGGRCKTQPSGKSYTMCSSGCGVTSAAMVVAFYRRDLANQNLPAQVAKLSSDNGFRNCNADCSSCSGTSPRFFTSRSGLGQYGLTGEQLKGGAASKDRVVSLLRQGKPIIAAVNNGGHYVVLTGVNSDGSISMNDPNGDTPARKYGGEDRTHVSADKVFSSWTVGFWYVHP